MSTLKLLGKTPASLGYTFPAEWEPHAGTWFSWPRPEGISFPDKYHTVPANLAVIFAAIAKREAVHINVPNGNYERIVQAELKAHGCPLKNIFFHHIKTNESWCRDHGPAFVVNREEKKLAIVDWGFNAWGGKYPPYDDDDAVPDADEAAVRSDTGNALPRFRIRKSSWKAAASIQRRGHRPDHHRLPAEQKSQSRSSAKPQIEQYLKDYYGQKHICWLTGGIEGDDTDGHVDDLARFISPNAKLSSAWKPDSNRRQLTKC